MSGHTGATSRTKHWIEFESAFLSELLSLWNWKDESREHGYVRTDSKASKCRPRGPKILATAKKLWIICFYHIETISNHASTALNMLSPVVTCSLDTTSNLQTVWPYWATFEKFKKHIYSFTKLAQILGNFLYYLNTSLLCKNCFCSFFGQFWLNLGYFQF